MLNYGFGCAQLWFLCRPCSMKEELLEGHRRRWDFLSLHYLLLLFQGESKRIQGGLSRILLWVKLREQLLGVSNLTVQENRTE